VTAIRFAAFCGRKCSKSRAESSDTDNVSDTRHESSHAPDDVEPASHESVDEVEFHYPTDRLARRPKRKPLEPGFGRTLGLAALAGVGLGIGVYFFKPEPRTAVASPRSDGPVKQYSEPRGLFDLPEWDERAYHRDLEAGRAPVR
jgi:hypothetical protein